MPGKKEKEVLEIEEAVRILKDPNAYIPERIEADDRINTIYAGRLFEQADKIQLKRAIKKVAIGILGLALGGSALYGLYTLFSSPR